MGWFSPKDVAEPIKAVGELYTKDKDRLAAEAEHDKIAASLGEKQLENNRLLMASASFFNSAWVALIGWTCGFLVLLYYAPLIVITTYFWAKGGALEPYPMPADDILNLIYLLLGFGSYHLLDKKINK